ncbi:UNVERIFIED_CONTAM: Aluminum-activated malate transporter 8 [Sesamum latifolium]|uniref:Aluminum-activated malate transporter 8 n=1 Tax=Sesamum latifolium TaxID=2727402 RepID=A0AAW2UK57_9LAMI
MYDYGMGVLVETFCLVALSSSTVDKVLHVAYQRLFTIVSDQLLSNSTDDDDSYDEVYKSILVSQAIEESLLEPLGVVADYFATLSEEKGWPFMIGAFVLLIGKDLHDRVSHNMETLQVSLEGATVSKNLSRCCATFIAGTLGVVAEYFATLCEEKGWPFTIGAFVLLIGKDLHDRVSRNMETLQVSLEGATVSKNLSRCCATFIAGTLGVVAEYFATLSEEKGGPFMIGAFVLLIGQDLHDRVSRNMKTLQVSLEGIGYQLLSNSADDDDSYEELYKSILDSRATEETLCGEKGGTFKIGAFVLLIVKNMYDYGMEVLVETFCLVPLLSFTIDKVLHVAYERLFTIVIGGSLICMATSILFYPIWASQDLHDRVSRNMETLQVSLEGATVSKSLSRCCATFIPGTLGVVAEYFATLCGEKGGPFMIGTFVLLIGEDLHDRVFRNMETLQVSLEGEDLHDRVSCNMETLQVSLEDMKNMLEVSPVGGHGETVIKQDDNVVAPNHVGIKIDGPLPSGSKDHQTFMENQELH